MVQLANQLLDTLRDTRQLAYRGMTDIADRKRQKELDEERRADRQYQRERQDKMFSYQEPALEEKRRMSEQELAAQDSPITLARMAPNDETMEWFMWRKKKPAGRDPKQGEPTDMGKANYEKFEDMFNAKMITDEKDPNYGRFIKRDTGQPLTQRDVMAREDEVTAWWTANRGHGRTFRAIKDRLQEQLRTGEIDQATYSQQYNNVLEKEGSPLNRIGVLDQEIEFLSKFNTKDAKAGLARKRQKREKLLNSIKAQKPKDGTWKYNEDLEAYVNDKTMEMRPVRVKKLDKDMVDKTKIGDKWWTNKALRNTYETIFLSKLGYTPSSLKALELSGEPELVAKAQAVRDKMTAMQPYDEWVGEKIRTGKVWLDPNAHERAKLGERQKKSTSYKNIYTRQ